MGFDARTHGGRIGAVAALIMAVLAGAVVVPTAPAAASGTGRGCVITEAAPTPPGPPGAPFVTDYLPHGVALEWPPAAPGSCPIATYQVYGTANGATTLVATSTAPFVRIFGLATAIYTFHIAAVDSSHAVSSLSPGVTVGITAIPPVSDPPCIVTYTLDNQPGTFTLTVTLRNEALVTPPINGWTLTFPMGGDQRVTGASNATATQTGPQVTATNVASDAVIPYNHAVTFSMQGTWSANGAAPGTAVLIAAPLGRLIC